MSYLTNSMTVARFTDSKDLMFFPFSEGSGDDISCAITGALVTDATGATHAIPNAVTFGMTVVAPTGGAMPDFSGKHLLFACVGTLRTHTSTNSNLLGGVAGMQLEVSADYVGIDSDAGAAVRVQDVTAVGDTFISAGSFDKTTGLLSKFYGTDGGAVVASGTIDASDHIAASATANTIKLGGIDGSNQDYYLIFVKEVDVIPTDAKYIEWLDTIYANALNGIKELPVAMVGI